MAIDRIAQQEGVVVQNRRCRAVTATCRMAGREVILAKPETFMNLSGVSVATLVREFEADPARDLLVIYDELDLTLVIVEHHVPLVARVCDYVYCLESGALIAEGKPADVTADPRVVESFLGRTDAASGGSPR